MAAITRASILMVLLPPKRSNSPSCRTRSNFGCNSSGNSPISSRKMVDPSAISKRPGCRARAPVNAPFSRPNSSDSIRLAGSAAQLTLIIALSFWALESWIAWASTSFPLPVSPSSSTVELVSATCLISSTRDKKRGERLLRRCSGLTCAACLK